MTEENGSALSPDDRKPESSKDIVRYPDQKDGKPNHPNSNTVTITANAKHATNEGRRHTKDNQKHWLEYLTALLALVAAISGSLAAGFSYYQGWVARDTETRYLRSYVMIEFRLLESIPAQS
jgi:hypothetical protein